MELITIFTMAVGLAMDAFAVSVVSGAAYRRLHIGHALRMAAFFGGFQAFMPLVGSLAGLTLKGHLDTCGPCIAFVLLAAVGAKMIYESFKIKQAEERGFDPTSLAVVLSLAVATSIDALVVGITLSLVVQSVILAVTVIGAVTFVLSFLGAGIGKRFGHFFEIKLEAIGGCILIAIGIKILVRGLLAG